MSRIGTPGAMLGGMESLSGVETGLYGSNAPGPPSPPPVTGYVLWGNASVDTYTDTGLTTAAVNDGDVVKGWKDQSINAHNLTEATNPPVLKLTRINGHSSLLFDGSNDKLKASAFTLNQPYTVFLVYKPVDVSNNPGFYDGNTALASLYYYNSGFHRYAGSIAAITGPSIGSWCIVSHTWNGASSVDTMNGGTSTGNNAGSNNLGGFTLGCVGDSTSFANMEVAEVIIYPSALSGTDRTTVRDYLNTRYAIF